MPVIKGQITNPNCIRQIELASDRLPEDIQL